MCGGVKIFLQITGSRISSFLADKIHWWLCPPVLRRRFLNLCSLLPFQEIVQEIGNKLWHHRSMMNLWNVYKKWSRKSRVWWLGPDTYQACRPSLSLPTLSINQISPRLNRPFPSTNHIRMASGNSRKSLRCHWQSPLLRKYHHLSSSWVEAARSAAPPWWDSSSNIKQFRASKSTWSRSWMRETSRNSPVP